MVPTYRNASNDVVTSIGVTGGCRLVKLLIYQCFFCVRLCGVLVDPRRQTLSYLAETTSSWGDLVGRVGAGNGCFRCLLTLLKSCNRVPVPGRSGSTSRGSKKMKKILVAMVAAGLVSVPFMASAKIDGKISKPKYAQKGTLSPSVPTRSVDRMLSMRASSVSITSTTTMLRTRQRSQPLAWHPRSDIL